MNILPVARQGNVLTGPIPPPSELAFLVVNGWLLPSFGFGVAGWFQIQDSANLLAELSRIG
jgi:hypothetical protein